MNIFKALSSKKGEIGTIVVLIGMAVIGLGILVGSQVRDGRINFLPRASTNLTQESTIWNNVKPGTGNIYPWTNGGPTESWESYMANYAYICNGKFCWTFDRNNLAWLNGGAPFEMDKDPGYAVKAAPNGKFPWSDRGVTAAWTWAITSNGQAANETILCNGNYCWRYLRYPNGVSGSGWRDGGSPIYLPTANSVWSDSRVAPLFTGNGLTVAWTDPVNSQVTLCNHADCRSMDYKTFTWRYNGTNIGAAAPSGSGITEYTSAWTSPTTNVETLCNKNLCYLYDINAKSFASAPIIITPAAPTTAPTAVSQLVNLSVKVNVTNPNALNTIVVSRDLTACNKLNAGSSVLNFTCNSLTRGTKYKITAIGADANGIVPVAGTSVSEDVTIPTSGTPSVVTLNITLPKAPAPTAKPTTKPTVAPTARPASSSQELWNNVKPILVNGANIYPWSNGGPTESWESYIANFAYICNGKYCWTLNRNTLSWENAGSPFEMDKNSGYAVKAAPNGKFPWSDRGVTAAWTWVVQSNGQAANETILCNGNYCWRYLRYPNGVSGSGWRDGGSPIYLPTANSVWSDSRVKSLFTGNGPTVAWTDPVNSRLTLCNHTDCRSMDYKTFTWRFEGATFKPPVPAGSNITEYTAAWTSPATNIISLCNKNVCYQYDINAQAFVSTPVTLINTNPTPTIPKATPTIVKPTAAPTARPPTSTQELWNRIQPIVVNGANVYPWTNGGPTAGWESYFGNMAYICNGKYCWILDRSKLDWTNGGRPTDLERDPGYSTLKASSTGIFPWSGNGPTAAWTWDITYNGQIVNEAILCNGNYCWRYIRYPNGVSGSAWRDGGNPIYLPTANSVWSDSRVAPLFTGSGITVAWTDPVNKRVTLCNHADCRSMDYKTFTWRFDGKTFAPPMPAGSKFKEYTSGWTSPATYVETLCYRNECYLYDINAQAFSSTTPFTLISTVATPTIARGTNTPTPKATNTPTPRVIANAKPVLTSYTWNPAVAVVGDNVSATITGTDTDSSQVHIEVHVVGTGVSDTVFVKGDAIVNSGKWTFKTTQKVPSFSGNFITYVIMNDGVNSVKSANYTVSVLAPTAKNTCPRKAEGDANCNGTVDILDISCWIQEALGHKPAGCISGDFNSNGIVNYEKDFLDLSIWRSTFIRENSIKK